MNTNHCAITEANDISENRSLTDPWLARVERLLSYAVRKAEQMHLLRQLAALPDHVLLDIGIDPRNIPNAAGELIQRPDLVQSGMAVPIWRMTAKS